MKVLNRTTCQEAASYPDKIVQFGGGNFLRGFADWIVHRMNVELDYNAGISIIQSSVSRASDQLNLQEGLYHLVTSSIVADEVVQKTERIDCVNRSINPRIDRPAFMRLAENPAVQLVISNTTEAGIVLSEGDLADSENPASYPARLGLLLHHRYQYFNGAEDKGLVIICCEMIEDAAGQLLDLVRQVARQWQYSVDFIEWLESSNTFCSSLVDRIVPGFPGPAASGIQERLGYEDQLLVEANDYYLWVIEAPVRVREMFAASRAGLNVIYTDNLAPYRERKIKILNGSHTASAAASMLMALETVQQSIEHPLVRRFMRALIEREICPTIALPEDELNAYTQDILDRFANPAIRHEWSSITLNSLSKWGVRLLPTLRDYHERFGYFPRLIVFSLAALSVLYRGEYRNRRFSLNDDCTGLLAMEQAWATFDGSELATLHVAQVIMKLVGADIERDAVLAGLDKACAAAIAQISEQGMEQSLASVLSPA